MKSEKQKPVQANKPSRHIWRTLFASFFGFIGLNLVLLSIVAVWLGSTLTNTDHYIKTVTPLVNDKVVSDYVANKVSHVLVEQARKEAVEKQAQLEQSMDGPIWDIAKQVLPADAYTGKTVDTLAPILEPVITQTVTDIVASDRFEVLWVETNRTMHEKLVYGLTHPNSDITIDLHPVIEGVMAQFEGTKLAFLTGKIEIPSDVGIVTVQSDKLDDIRSVYNYFNIARFAILVCAVLAVVLAVLVSVNHQKTFRRILIATGVMSILFALSLGAVSLLPAIGNSPEDTALAKAIVTILFADLKRVFMVISVVSIVLALISKLFDMFLRR